MPLKDDRRISASSARWIATALCCVLLSVLIPLGMKQGVLRSVPPELKIPAARPAVAPSSPRKSSPEIRVNLTSTPQASLKIGVRGPYVVRSLQTKQVLMQGDRLEPANLAPGKTGLALSGKTFPNQPLEFAPKAAALVSVNQNAYHGSVRVYPQPSGKLTAVNVVPLEEYVSCVIDAEMPAKFPPAAREAQAIVARTYALWQIQEADPAATYDVFATVRSQKYLGAEYAGTNGRRLAGESTSSRAAAEATRGLICRANGRLFCTYYSAVCGGATTPGREIFSDADAVLRSVPCQWCREADKYRWTAELSAEEVLAVVRKQKSGKQLTRMLGVRQTTGPDAGVISQFEISDGRRTATISGMMLRQGLPTGKLLSPHFSMELSQGKIAVEGRGFGHGAGLCQWGARGLANTGKSARQIVEHYYPGAAISKWDE